jgi:long-chain acyl-CoA synthetase
MLTNEPTSSTEIPKRICDILQPWIHRTPNHPALIERGGVWTYSELATAVELSVTWLEEAGVRPGDRVMIVFENCRAFVAIFFALAKLDAWPVLASARISPQEVDRIRDHCGARRIIYTVAVSPLAMKHANRHGAEIQENATLGSVGIGALNDTVTPEPMEIDVESNVAAVIYTSGTTGNPKGVMLTHRSVLHVALNSSKIRSVTQDDRYLAVLPMSHAVGLAGVLLGALICGAALFLLPKFDPAAVLDSIRDDHLTILMGAPAMFALLIDYAKLKRIKSINSPSLRLISSSGAPLEPNIKSGVESLFGIVLHNGYGVTECSPTISLTSLETPRTDLSVGRLFPGVEMQLIDQDGRLVSDGAVGELRVRGPNLMKGYYRAPEETATAIDPKGWFNTRDLARFEDDHLFIVGRTKELIIRFGFNVYPAEVEAVLNAHTSVARSAVLGHRVAGEEEVIAFVQLLPGATTSVGDLSLYASRNLAPYKRPTHIYLVAELPVTPTGKVAKDQLANKLLPRS